MNFEVWPQNSRMRPINTPHQIPSHSGEVRNFAPGGAFFAGSTPTTQSGSITVTVSAYSTESSATSSFRAAQRAYLSTDVPDARVTRRTVDTDGAPSFVALYEDDSQRIATAYISYPRTLVQVSVTASASTQDAVLAGIVATVTQWAAAAGYS